MWHGGSTAKETVTLPAASIQNVVVTDIEEGVRRFPSVILAEPQGGGVVISPVLKDGKTIDQVAAEVAQALGFPAERILRH